MSSWALLGGLMGGAQAAQTLLLDKARQMEKDKDKADEEALWEKRQRIMESLKAPAEKVEEIDDPDKPGWKLKVTKQWNPPTQDGQKGAYVEVGRAAVPPSLKKDKISLAGNKEQDILYDDAGNIKPLGAPRDIFDPTSKERLGLEGSRLDLERKRFDVDTGLKVKELADKQAERLDAKNNAQHERYSFHEQDDPTTPSGKKGYKFDKFTGEFNPTTTGGIKPGGGLVSEMAQQPTDPGEFAPTSSPLNQLSSNSGGAGSGGSMAPTQAKGAASKGPPVAKKLINGVMWYKFSDGSTAPAN